MPELHELQRLCRGDVVVNIIRAVAPSWESFALCLTMDRIMIDIWKRNADEVEDATRKLFGHWLEGNGRQPISWKTLIQALRENDLPMIATKVEEILTGSSGEIFISQLHTDKTNAHAIRNAHNVLCVVFLCIKLMMCVHAIASYPVHACGNKTPYYMGHFNMISLNI